MPSETKVLYYDLTALFGREASGDEVRALVDMLDSDGWKVLCALKRNRAIDFAVNALSENPLMEDRYRAIDAAKWHECMFDCKLKDALARELADAEPTPTPTTIAGGGRSVREEDDFLPN